MKNNRSVVAVLGMAALLAPALHAAAPVATEEPRKPKRTEQRRVETASVHQTVLPRMLEFAAESIETEQSSTMLASPHRPPDRPPQTPPGHNNPPNPPGKPPRG